MKQTINKLSIVSLIITLLFTITPITSIASDKLPLSKQHAMEEELSTSVQENKSISRRSVTVTNYDALKTVIESGSISEVILGNDIGLTGVITLPAQDIIIDGNGHKLTQRTTGTYLSLPRGNGLNIELKNMVATTKTYYGILSIADGCTSIDLTFNQVTFHGPQLAFNRRGTINFAGNNQIYVEPTSGGNTNQEVAEAMNIIFKADTTTTISHTSSANAAFWLGGAGSNNNKQVVIEDRATVDITTNNTLIYADYSSPTLTVGKYANFTLKASQGTGTRINQISSVDIDDYASVTITDHPTTNSNVPLLKVESSIILGTESSLDVTSSTGRTNLIFFNKTGGSITAFEPKYINLSNNGTNLINTTSGGTLSFYYLVQNVNHWHRPLAGKLLPTEIWSDPVFPLVNNVSIKGTANTTGTTGGATTTTLLQSDIPDYAPAFNLYEKFTVGSGKISLDDVGDSHSVITGLTTPNAFIIITYPNQAGTTVTLTGTANASGQFSIATTPIQQGTTITAYSAPLNRPIAKTETTVKDLTPPTANPVTQIVPVNTNLTNNPRDVISDLKDNLSPSEKIKVTFSTDPNKQPKLDKIGLTYVYVLLEDEANNTAEIKVPVFVTSGDSQTSANLNEAIYGEDFTIKRSQVTGDTEAIKALVFNQAKILAWNTDQYLTKEELTITLDPKLTSNPEPGVYQATFAYGGITHSIYVTVLDSTKLIAVKIPVKMLFGSMDIDAGNIHSPTYAIENQSPFAVNVSL